MCKLLLITNLEKINVSKNLLKNLGEVISDQKDGCGFVLKNNYGETIFHRGHNTESSLKRIDCEKYSGEIPFKDYGNISTNIDSLQGEGNNQLLFHSRISTNTISLEATHPFKIKNDFFAHNGIIEISKNHNYPTKTDNDSEYLGYYLNDKGKKALKSFEGYAATITLKADNTIEIFRDSKAYLHFSYSKNLDCFIFTTSISDCEKIGKLLSDDFSLPELLEDNTFLVLKDNKVFEVDNIQRIEKTGSEKLEALSHKAFSYKEGNSEVLSTSENDYLFDIENNYVFERDSYGIDTADYIIDNIDYLSDEQKEMIADEIQDYLITEKRKVVR